MGSDKYAVHFLSESGSEGYIVTSDSGPNEYQGIRIGAAGDVNLINLDGQTQVWNDCVVGEIIPVKTSKVLATGTTAAKLIGL